MSVVLNPKAEISISEKLQNLYGEGQVPALVKRLENIIGDFKERYPEIAESNTEIPHDVVLITYGDQIQEKGKSNLKSLHEWLSENLAGVLGRVHILPFYPYSSDDGFSVIDYRAVDKNLGNWSDVRNMGKDFDLMFDAVINHVSKESLWFKSFLRNEKPYNGYFKTVDPKTDLSGVTRARTSPLLHPFETPEGVKHVWTTFSEDQIDLDPSNPEVMIEIIELLLFYVARGSMLIRLDAVAYFWKEIGTNCASLPQTHTCVQLIRDVMLEAAPGVLLVTETNVPHAENISYFGDGHNEAQMVYQFALPPLLIDAVYRGKTDKLNEWAESLEPLSDETAFFNVTATHDGIGVRGASAYISIEERDALAKSCMDRGGDVKFRTGSAGQKVPYEMCSTFFDAILPVDEKADSDKAIERYMTVQSVALSMAGVPGIYVHNLFGTRNWHEGFKKTKAGRTLNRRKFKRSELDKMLSDKNSRENKIFEKYCRLIRLWKGETAFHPSASQEVIRLDDSVFAVLRGKETDSPIIALHNMTDEKQKLSIEVDKLELDEESSFADIISMKPYSLKDGKLEITLKANSMLWIKKL